MWWSIYNEKWMEKAAFFWCFLEEEKKNGWHSTKIVLLYLKRKMGREKKKSTAATLLSDAIKDRFSIHFILFCWFVVILLYFHMLQYMVEHMKMYMQCNVAENGCDYENSIGLLFKKYEIIIILFIIFFFFFLAAISVKLRWFFYLFFTVAPHISSCCCRRPGFR